MSLIDNLTEWFDKISAYGSGRKPRPSQSAAGELSPDLSLRNREIFEQLIGLETEAHETAQPQRETFSPPNDETVRDIAPLNTFKPPHQEIEVFSLERGALQNLETVFTPAFVPPSGMAIEFPALSKNIARAQSDALESLYHDLEVEARRSSQLICEEETG